MPCPGGQSPPRSPVKSRRREVRGSDSMSRPNASGWPSAALDVNRLQRNADRERKVEKGQAHTSRGRLPNPSPTAPRLASEGKRGESAEHGARRCCKIQASAATGRLARAGAAHLACAPPFQAQSPELPPPPRPRRSTRDLGAKLGASGLRDEFKALVPSLARLLGTSGKLIVTMVSSK